MLHLVNLCSVVAALVDGGFLYIFFFAIAFCVLCYEQTIEADCSDRAAAKFAQIGRAHV